MSNTAEAALSAVSLKNARSALSGADYAKIAVVLILIATVWAYARFGDTAFSLSTVPSGIGAFSAPVAFVATPGANLAHINLRSGPGAEYRILEKLDRGTPLNGIARVVDSKGAAWIEIAGARGFAKESVLSATPSGGP